AETPSTSNLREQVERCQKEGGLPASLISALDVLLLTGEGDTLLLREKWHQHPSDALLSGALLAVLEGKRSDSGSIERTRADVRARAAANTDDLALRAAWLLRNAGDSLVQGDARTAQELIQSSGVFEQSADLSSWFESFVGALDPQAELSRLRARPKEGDRALQRATLTRRWAPSDWRSLEITRPASALQILRVLHDSVDS